MSLKIKSTDRVTICGMPGTGKTTFMKHLLGGYPDCYVYDPLSQYGEFPRHVPAVINSREEFDSYGRRIWYRGNVCFGIEESELYLNQGKPLTPWAARVIISGRNRGIGVMANTRRLAMLSKDMFSLSEHVFIFRLFSPNDIEYLVGYIGKEWAAVVPRLDDFEFLHYSGGRVEQCPPLSL